MVIYTIQWHMKLSYNSSNSMNNDITKFTNFEFFDIKTSLCNELRLLQIIRKIPNVGWIKINNDGVTRRWSHGDYDNNFRGNHGEHIDNFSSCLEVNKLLCVVFG